MPDIREISPENDATFNELGYFGRTDRFTADDLQFLTTKLRSRDAKKRYVAGFLFSADSKRVALILKERPDWKKGFLNGIGGKIEPGESPAEAMRREFREEAALDLTGWEEFCLLSGEDWCVHWFRKWLIEGEDDLLSQETDEVVLWAPLEFIGTGNFRTISNLGWLIPMALDKKIERSLVHGT